MLNYTKEEILKRNKEKMSKIDQSVKTWASVSEINKYLNCKRQWALDTKYPTPSKVNLVIGSAFHHALEAYYNYTPDVIGTSEEMLQEQLWFCQAEAKKFIDAETEKNPALITELFTQRDLLDNMIETYIKYANNNDKFEWCITELLIIEEIAPNILFKGFIDALVSIDGKLWIMEHKTAKIVTQEHLDKDLQIGAYIAVIEKHLDVEIEGIIYNQAKKKIPSTPKINKDGNVSAAACDTTVAKYQEVLDLAYTSRGIAIPTVYKSKLAELEETEKEFMMRTKWFRTPTEKENVLDFLRDVISDIKADRSRPIERCYPNVTKDCSWRCDNKHLCLMVNRGEKLPEPVKIKIAVEGPEVTEDE